jgi:hypothetical protein
MSNPTISEMKTEIKALNKVLGKDDQIAIGRKKLDELIEGFIGGVNTLSDEEYDNLDPETMNIFLLVSPEEVNEEEGEAGDALKSLDDIDLKELKKAVTTLNKTKTTTNIVARGKNKEKLLELFLEALAAVPEDKGDDIPAEVWDFNDSCYEAGETTDDGTEDGTSECPEDAVFGEDFDTIDTCADCESRKSCEDAYYLINPEGDSGKDGGAGEDDGTDEKDEESVPAGILAPAYNKTFKDVMNMVDEDTLVTQPAFQRNSGIWKTADQVRLIKTMLAGYPIPEIYFAEVEDETVLIDGQQRINVMHAWFSGTLKGQVKGYDKLTQKAQKAINNYPLVVRDLGVVSVEQVEEIFRNLNATAYSLNKIEIFNSEYGGAGGLFDAGRDLIDHSLFVEYKLFSVAQKHRMLNIEYTLTILSTLLSFSKGESYFTGTGPLKKWVGNYGEKYPAGKATIKKFNIVASLVESVKMPVISIWTKKSALFTLLTELMKLKTLPKKDVLKKKLKAFESKVDDVSVDDYANEGKKMTPYIEFHKNISQATGSKVAREQRAECVRKYILK